MENTRRPRWFQIHLFTAILLMFVAGVLMWLNVSANGEGKCVRSYEVSGSFFHPIVSTYRVYGWPIRQDRKAPPVVFINPRPGIDLPVDEPRIDTLTICGNVAIALAIVAAIAIVLEFRIRRNQSKPLTAKKTK